MTFQQRIERYLGSAPRVPPTAYVAPGAVVVGDVTLGERSSIWFGAVLRGDINAIRLGEGSNVQDGAVIHVADAYGAEIGDLVTIGHRAIVHACRVEDEVLVGMGAIIMDGCHVGRRSMIGAGALLTKGTVVPAGSLVLGSPARVVRPLTQEEQEAILGWAQRYVTLSREYLKRA